MVSITSINTLWRPVHGKLVRGLALLTPEWKDLKRLSNFRQLSMRRIAWPVELTHGGGIAFTEDGGSLARATSNEPPEAEDTWRHMVGRFEVSFDVLDAENDAKFASAQIEKQLRYQAADKLRSFRRALAISFYGHSHNILFNTSNPVDGTGNEVVFDLNDLYNETGLMPIRIRDYLTKNKDRVSIVNDPTGTPTVVDSGLVVDIDEANQTVTVDMEGATAAAGFGTESLVLANQVQTGAASDLDRGINGLLDLTRAATLHNIPTADQPDWVAGLDIANHAAAVTGTELFRWFTDIDQRSDYAPEWVRTTPGAIAAAGGPELDQRRYGSEDDTMRLGFNKLNVMGVIADARPYVPPGLLFIGNNSALRKLSPDEDTRDVVDMGEKAGSFQQYENELGFYKDQVFRCQLTVKSRLALGVVGGVSEA